MENQIIKTWLPLFSGFYYSTFEPDNEIDDYLYNLNNEPNEFNRVIEWDNLDFDFENYQNDVAKFCCKFVEYELSHLGINSIEFEDISSPKYYNFSNDSINCTISINPQIISEYIYKNSNSFIEYLRDNYTNYDGFISSYSNSFGEWAYITNNFTDFENCHEHYLGSILQFICQNEELTEFMIFEEWYQNHWIGEYITIKEIETI